MSPAVDPGGPVVYLRVRVKSGQTDPTVVFFPSKATALNSQLWCNRNITGCWRSKTWGRFLAPFGMCGIAMSFNLSLFPLLFCNFPSIKYKAKNIWEGGWLRRLNAIGKNNAKYIFLLLYYKDELSRCQEPLSVGCRDYHWCGSRASIQTGAPRTETDRRRPGLALGCICIINTVCTYCMKWVKGAPLCGPSPNPFPTVRHPACTSEAEHDACGWHSEAPCGRARTVWQQAPEACWRGRESGMRYPSPCSSAEPLAWLISWPAWQLLRGGLPARFPSCPGYHFIRSPSSFRAGGGERPPKLLTLRCYVIICSFRVLCQEGLHQIPQVTFLHFAYGAIFVFCFVPPKKGRISGGNWRRGFNVVSLAQRQFTCFPVLQTLWGKTRSTNKYSQWIVKDSKAQRRWQPVSPRQEQRQCRGGFCVPALGQTPVVCHLPTAAACQWLSAARLTEAAPLFTLQWWCASSASGEKCHLLVTINVLLHPALAGCPGFSSDPTCVQQFCNTKRLVISQECSAHHLYVFAAAISSARNWTSYRPDHSSQDIHFRRLVWKFPLPAPTSPNINVLCCDP